MLKMNEAPPERCPRCNNIPSDTVITCAGCQRVKPSCGGCARGWSQSSNCVRLGVVEHRCAHCSLTAL